MGCIEVKEILSTGIRETRRMKMFENETFWRIFGEEETGIRRKLRCTLHQIGLLLIRVIKSRRMRWVGHVARIGEMIHKLTGF
jgi:hypothetical protein